MGDAPFITLLSLLPLFLIVLLIGAAFFVWRIKNRRVRRIIAIVMMVFGIFIMFSPLGMLFSVGGGVLFVATGIFLLILIRSSDSRSGE